MYNHDGLLTASPNASPRGERSGVEYQLKRRSSAAAIAAADAAVPVEHSPMQHHGRRRSEDIHTSFHKAAVERFPNDMSMQQLWIRCEALVVAETALQAAIVDLGVEAPKSEEEEATETSLAESPPPPKQRWHCNGCLQRQKPSGSAASHFDTPLLDGLMQFYLRSQK